MGTSKSNSGPTKNTSLLPDWALEDEANNEGDKSKEQENDKITETSNSEPLTDWKEVRNAITNYFKSSNNSGKLNRALSRYVKASGGSKRIAQSAISGKASAIKLGGLLSNIASHGHKEAFREFGIDDLSGKSVEVIFAMLAESLSPNGNEADDPYARSAISEALSKIYLEFELNEKDLSVLDSLDENRIHEFLEYYIESYISERLFAEFGKSLEEKDFTEKEVIDKEFEMKEYIKGAVELEFKDIDLNSLNLSNNENEKKITEIFEMAYSIMEDL